MLVGRGRAGELITVAPSTKVGAAFHIMREHEIRHLPVVERGRLVGIVSDRDLRQALEIERSEEGDRFYYAIQDVTVEETMARGPITVSPTTHVEHAAKLMLTHKIGCLPIEEEGKPVGIITNTDILELFVEILGVLRSTARIDVVLGSDPGELARTQAVLTGAGASVLSVTMETDESTQGRLYSFRVEGAEVDELVEALRTEGIRVTDAGTE